jgi:hypothetical protein
VQLLDVFGADVLPESVCRVSAFWARGPAGGGVGGSGMAGGGGVVCVCGGGGGGRGSRVAPCLVDGVTARDGNAQQRTLNGTCSTA